MENETILETKGNLKNGQQFCPNCGANAIYYEPSIGKLFCPYCESIFEGKRLRSSRPCQKEDPASLPRGHLQICQRL